MGDERRQRHHRARRELPGRAVFDTETIVYAEIDPADLVEAKRWVDGVGHYSRPDVFRLHWDRSPKPPIVRE